MSRCAAEMCPSWTGDGCVCEVFGINVDDWPCVWCECSAFECELYRVRDDIPRRCCPDCAHRAPA